jgi:hypothetical protein
LVHRFKLANTRSQGLLSPKHCGLTFYIRIKLKIDFSRSRNENDIYSYEAGYIDDVPSLNNSRFGDFVDCIYPTELEIKDTTDTDMFASYLDLHLEIDSKGRLRTPHYKPGVNSGAPEG